MVVRPVGLCSESTSAVRADPSRVRARGREQTPALVGHLEAVFTLWYSTIRVSNPLTIGELARAAAVPTSTVRYYERAKLLSPSARTPSNYRLYSLEDLQRLRFIRAAQATGFTLEDIRELLRPAPCHRVQGRIESRLEEVAERIRGLRHVQRVLEAALQVCREHEASGRCGVIDSISASTRGRLPRK